MNITRRQFGALSAGLVGSLARLDAQAPSRSVYAGFDRAVVFDGLSADEDWNDATSTLDAYKRSGLSAIHASLNYSNLAAALGDLAAWQGRFDRWPDRFLKVLKGAQLLEARASGRLGVILGFQNAAMIGSDLSALDRLYAAGARCIQLTYNGHNLLGDGCTQPVDGGLTPFGASVVERMNAMGIAVDLSHCGLVTSRDGVRASRRPPALTHTMCSAVYPHVRAKPDDLLKAAADRGGMVGIVTLGYFVGPTAATSLDDYLRHIDHAVKVAGIDHVGIASDYSIRGIEATRTRENWYVPRLSSFPPEYRVRWPPWVADLDPPERFRNIANGLARRGYPDAQIAKILGENWSRYFTEILG